MASEELATSPQLDKRLLRYAHLSANEIQERTGVPAGEVAARLSMLLDEPHYRDDILQEKLLLKETSDLIADIRDKMSQAYDTEEYVALARVMTTNVRAMLDQIERRRKALDVDLSKITQEQAKLLALAVELAAQKAELDLREMYPDILGEQVHQVFRAALAPAVERIESRVS